MFSLHLVAKFSRRPRSPRHWPFFRASAIAMAAAWLPISRYFQVIPGESLVKIRGGWPMMAWCSTQDATCRAPCRYQQTSWSVCTSASIHQRAIQPFQWTVSQKLSTSCNTLPYFCTSILLFLQNSPRPLLRKTDPDHLLRRLNLWFLASRTDPSRMQRAGSQQALVFIEITKRAMVMECSFTA